MKNLVLRCVVVCLVLGASMAAAGDEQLARKYAEKSGFRDDIARMLKTRRANSGVFAKSFDQKAVEEAYVKGLARQMSNAELEALIQAYDIPGFKTAMQKMPLVTSELMGVIFKEIRSAAGKAGVK